MLLYIDSFFALLHHFSKHLNNNLRRPSPVTLPFIQELPQSCTQANERQTDDSRKETACRFLTFCFLRKNPCSRRAGAVLLATTML